VAVKVDAAGLYAAQYKLTYDPTLLTLTGTADGAFVGSGVCSTDTATAGVVTVYCTRYEPNLDVNNTSGETITTLTFKADLDASHDGEDGPWTTHLDLSVLPVDLTAGARGGVKVFVNNGGFGADSGKPGHIITDVQDGQVNITGLAQYTGYIDLQGQTDDSGAVLAVYNQAAVAGSVKLASATSAKGGKYTTAFESGQQMVVGATYYFQVDRVLYLPTTRVFAPAAVSWADFKVLSDRPETLLGMVVLLGGDATNDNIVELDDATCIGGDYGGAPDVCGTGGTSDVNGDGKIDILDLTLMGGNYMKTSSDWTP
jgi:hypothetical protein